MRDGDAGGLPAWRAALSGAAALSLIGILEWIARRPETPLELGARSLLSVVGVHATLGLAAGIAA